MVLLLLPKLSTRPNKVFCDDIQCYKLLTRYLLGFNMGNGLAVFLTYAAMLVDGNQITNLLSIGGKSSETGPDPPKPAIVGGLDTHAVFEGALSCFRVLCLITDRCRYSGDASTTRGKAHFINKKNILINICGLFRRCILW
jgi:hypothetical protein